jgi:hypothetical protein
MLVICTEPNEISNNNTFYSSLFDKLGVNNQHVLKANSRFIQQKCKNPKDVAAGFMSPPPPSPRPPRSQKFKFKFNHLLKIYILALVIALRVLHVVCFVFLLCCVLRK